MLSVGIDIGGTFTDFVAVDHEKAQIVTFKLLTTPAAPTLAVLEGLETVIRRIGREVSEVDLMVHGTTLAINAVIERRGARTALLSTAGFRDVLEIGRERRYDIYDILYRVPPPLVPRHLSWEAGERTGSDGSVVVPLDTGALIRELESLVSREPVDSIGICFLHAHINPGHERAARAAIQKRWPAVFVCASSDIVAEIGEYDRASTVSVNAYVQPVVKAYLEELTDGLASRGLRDRLFVMLSNGGLTTPDEAQQRPIGIIESGPAGGVQAAAAAARSLELENVIAFDMGGTTAKMCLITDGKPSSATDFEIARLDWSKSGSGIPVKAPFIEMVEIGTGGGSIAGVNSLGLLSVGPRSASAHPGPACYGLGGTQPTVTDADLILGYLRADLFADGAFTLDEGKAREAIEQYVAGPLGSTLEDAAWAIHEVANANMANAARLHAAQRGRDISDFSLFASGGAGPVHAAALARKLHLPRVVFPYAAGVASALGFLLSPVSFEVARALPQRLLEADCARVNAALEEMERESAGAVRRAGIERADVRFEYSCSMKYAGQGFSIEVPAACRRLDAERIVGLLAAFEHRYRELYAKLIPELAVEMVTWRVRATGPSASMPQFQVASGAVSIETARCPSRRAFDDSTRGFREFAVFNRSRLPADARFSGPAIVESPETTIVIGGGMAAETDRFGNVIVEAGDTSPQFATAASASATVA